MWYISLLVSWHIARQNMTRDLLPACWMLLETRRWFQVACHLTTLSSQTVGVFLHFWVYDLHHHHSLILKMIFFYQILLSRLFRFCPFFFKQELMLFQKKLTRWTHDPKSWRSARKQCVAHCFSNTTTSPSYFQIRGVSELAVTLHILESFENFYVMCLSSEIFNQCEFWLYTELFYRNSTMIAHILCKTTAFVVYTKIICILVIWKSIVWILKRILNNWVLPMPSMPLIIL